MRDDLAHCYFEIRNPEKDEIAATFIVDSGLIDAASQQRMPLPIAPSGVNEQYGTRLPEHGRPRSLSLDQPRIDVSLTELNELLTKEVCLQPFTGLREMIQKIIENENTIERPY